MTAGLPPPNWPLTTGEQITQPWYQYLKAADETWRQKVIVLTSLSTVGNPAADLIPNNCILFEQSVPATTRTLADPVPGCRVTICVQSTSTTGKITLQSTSPMFRSTAGTAGWKLALTSSDPYKVAELVGLTTDIYLVVNTRGVVTVTTT